MRDIFPDIERVPFEGPASKNPLAFRFYNAEERFGGTAMKDHLRFALSWWHTVTAEGADMFGGGTWQRPWDGISEPLLHSRRRAEGAFEMMTKLGLNFFCFHDRDLVPEGDSLRESNRRLDAMVDVLKELMRATGIRLLWNTSNLFSHPRYVHGAATSCNPEVFAFAAAATKKSLEVAQELGAENFVFWGGREGYETLLNTNMEMEQENLARFFHMALDYARQIGFQGQFLIEPKPKEPTKHQYDFDVATVLAFLHKYELLQDFKINIEANHATLAGHSFEHELALARIHGVLGSIDANEGDLLLGWDTDQFPTDVRSATLAMMQVLAAGGLAPGGLNFDARVRRGSFEPRDLFYGYIAGMDTFARGFRAAWSLRASGELEDFVAQRYAGWGEGLGARIRAGQENLASLEAYALEHDRVQNASGRQEMLESVLNRHLYPS